MAGREASFAALPPGAGRRLDRFAAEFERLSANDYVLFATSPDEETDLGAVARRATPPPGPRREAMDRAIKAFLDEAARAYSRRLVQTDTVFLFQSVADRAEDRVRFAASLERALTALVAWDDLEVDDRDRLLGPWVEMAERAAGGA